MSTEQAGNQPEAVPRLPPPAVGRRPTPTALKADADERRFLRRLYWMSFAARLGVGLLAYLVTYFELFGAPPLEDALGYEATGAQVADEWLAGRSSETLAHIVDVGTGGWGLVLLIAVFYFLCGGLRAIPVLMAFYGLLTAWTPVLTYRIGRQVGAPVPGARMGAWLVALSPAFALWSGALYKEGLILLLLSLSIYHAMLVQESGRVRSLVIVLVCLPALLSLRFYLAVLMSGILCMGLLLHRARSRLESPVPGLIRQILVVSIFVTALLGAGFADRVRSYLPEDLDEGLARINSSRQDLASYSSGYLHEGQVGRLDEALAFLPMGVLYFLATPFPWQIGSLRQNITIPETLFWVALYPFLLIGLRQGWRRNFQATFLVILITVTLCCFYGIYCGNIGTAYRMRTQVWCLWAPFIGWGWHHWQQSRLSRPASARRP